MDVLFMSIVCIVHAACLPLSVLQIIIHYLCSNLRTEAFKLNKTIMEFYDVVGENPRYKTWWDFPVSTSNFM